MKHCVAIWQMQNVKSNKGIIITAWWSMGVSPCGYFKEETGNDVIQSWALIRLCWQFSLLFCIYFVCPAHLHRRWRSSPTCSLFVFRLRNSFSLQDPHRHLSPNFLTKPSCKWTQSAVSSISDPPLLYIYIISIITLIHPHPPLGDHRTPPTFRHWQHHWDLLPKAWRGSSTGFITGCH